MKTDITTLRDSFKAGYEAYEDSRNEAEEVSELYHNRQFTREQLAILESRGQPPETFNVIKMFARMIVGYYSTVVNTVVAAPRHYKDVDSAAVLSATLDKVFELNRFDTEGDKIKLNGILTGLLVSYVDVRETGERDRFNRPLYEVVCHNVPPSQIVLDPESTADDYSDARYLHRFKWMTEERLIAKVGVEKVKELDAYANTLDIDEAEYDYGFTSSFTGSYRVFNNYLVIHTVVEDDDGRRWSVLWSGDVELKRTEITYKDTRWNYRVQRVHDSDKKEYYGIFRDVIASQHALNQAVIKIQLMVNSEKAFVQTNSVEDIDEFTRAFNRVNAVIEVKDLNGIKITQMSREIQDQYIIIDNALTRIQKVLGINESFLGQAMASDSGRKVKLQQNQTIMQLRYLTQRIESFYQSLGWDITGLVKQYYTANQVFNLADPVNGDRWVELNKPMEKHTGSFDELGQPIMTPILLPMFNPADGTLMEDDEGNIILAPVPESGTELAFTRVDIRIEANSYNDEDEKAQLLLESVMSGAIGQVLMQSDPASFLEVASLIIKASKTRYSPNIASILQRVAGKLDPAVAAMIQQGSAGAAPAQGPMSKTLKLPQNTNEGVA